MSEVMQVYLSQEKANSAWGNTSNISATEDSISIHLNEEPLLCIQSSARAISAMGIDKVKLCGENWDVENQWHFHQGFVSPKKPEGIEYSPLSEGDEKLLQSRVLVFGWVKEIINATPEDLSPVDLAEQAATFIKAMAPEQVTTKMIAGDELRQQGYVGIYNVGRGSDRPPVMLQLDFNPTGDENAEVDIALVGKGITFDSGGYSLKATEGMLHMKIDMGGAATTTAALALAILNGLDKRVRMFLCCAENLVNGYAYKLGDILKYRNGTSVEVSNTDAEGRIVLADGLIDASKTGAKIIIDAATLTGAAVIAVGTRHNAVMSLDEELQNRYLQYSKQENELHWPLPLEKWHAGECPSAYADTQNSRPVKGGGAGGASNAAGFLSRFVSNHKGWLHVDLAAVSCDSANKYFAAGATGQGVRTLARLLLEE